VNAALKFSKRPSKYGAKIVRENGEFFASRAEYRRYGELQVLERAGEIRPGTIQKQVRFPLFTSDISGQRVPLTYTGGREAVYVADYAYYDKHGRYRVEDVKSEATMLPIAKMKIAIVRANYGITVELVRR
jgi:hypothetical protein